MRTKKWVSDWDWQDAKNAWKGFNPAKHKRALLVVLIIGLALGIGGWVTDPSNGLFHSLEPTCPVKSLAIGAPCQDPTTLIWQSIAPNNDLSEFNTAGNLAQYQSGTNCANSAGSYTGSCMRLTPSATLSTQALTKNGVGDLSVTNGKTLAFHFSWTLVNTVSHYPAEWGYYLTTNSTVSQQANYLPRTDPSVLYNVRIFCSVNCGQSTANFVEDQYMIRSVGKGDTIASEGTDICGNSSNPLYICQTTNLGVQPGLDSGGPIADALQYINYTAKTLQNTCLLSGNIVTGAGCSWMLNALQPVTNIGWASTDTFPWSNIQVSNLYLGFYVDDCAAPCTALNFMFNNGASSGGNCQLACNGNMDIFYYVPTPTATTEGPQIDTGGFFGPVIKALINIGVFILNALLGFVAFIAPALQTALTFLETIVTNILNLIGNALGFGNVGTDLANFLNAVINFFTQQLPQYITNFPSYVTNFLSLLTIEFPFLAPIFTIANAILAFGVAGIAKAIAIFTIGLQMFLFGFGTLMVAAYFVYVGDDAIGGLFTYLGTLEALSFKILNIIAAVTNLGLDILVHVISLIPKPVIQMSAGHLPRLPTLESSASIVFPKLDFGDARNGNMVVYWLWSIGLYFMAWFETQNPALPGSIVALDPALATNIRIVGGFLPLLQSFVLISGGVLAIWFAMLPLRLAGIDVTEAPIGAALGERAGPGPGGVKLAIGKKHLIGKAKKIQQEIEARQVKKKEAAEKAIEKRRKELEEERRSKELRKEELARKSTGKDLRGPNLQ